MEYDYTKIVLKPWEIRLLRRLKHHGPQTVKEFDLHSLFLLEVIQPSARCQALRGYVSPSLARLPVDCCFCAFCVFNCLVCFALTNRAMLLHRLFKPLLDCHPNAALADPVHGKTKAQRKAADTQRYQGNNDF